MLWLSAAVALLAARAVAEAVAEAPAIVPGAYIVEYDGDQDTNAFLRGLGGDASLRRDLRFKLFKGASIQFKDAKKADALVAKVAGMPRIKRVFPVRRYSVPHHVVHSTGDAVQDTLARRQGGQDTFSTHLMTQVDMFKNRGITGEGIKIAVIDTGIDYLHPALGGCFGPGCLISYGSDLVGDSFNGSNAPAPDSDPLDCNGHGTHVAGIIAAQGNNPYGVVGAAQGVTLGAYRVFGCSGDVGNDILIAAYNMAYEAGSDIITASIGGPSGWADDPWAAVVSRIVDSGVPCVVSAGNDGSAGIFYASTAANGRGVTAVGSVDNYLIPSLLSNASFARNGAHQDFGFTAGDPAAWDGVSLPLWAVDFNTTDPAHGCEPYPDSTPDLADRIVLVRRGTCSFVDKAAHAAARGARYIIFYNNAAGTVIPAAVVEGVSAVAMVTAAQGEAWVRALAAGDEVVVSMQDPERGGKFLIYSPNGYSGGYVSDFTSWGPTFEVDVKPQFSSPGGFIVSTYPRGLGGYGVLSGTSMACPLVAAVYALIMKVRGTKDPRTIENLLSATARPNLFRLDGLTASALAPVPQQGAGSIQAWDAAHATTHLSVSSLSFNDTEHFRGTHEFRVRNEGDAEVSYALGHVGAATAYTFRDAGSIVPLAFPGALSADYASLALSPETFTLPPGGSQTVTVTASPPQGVDARRLPVYSGYIVVNATEGPVLSLPYLGVVGSMRSAVVVDPSHTYIRSSIVGRDARLPANATFVLPPPGLVNDTAYRDRVELPKIVVGLAMGSPHVRVYVVPLGAANATAVPNPFGLDTIGQPEGFPALFNPRGLMDFNWDGALEDGTYAPPGRYKFVVRALRIFGDADRVSEYDAAETVPINIRYLSGPPPAARAGAQREAPRAETPAARHWESLS